MIECCVNYGSQEVKRKQKSGPYSLAGYSFGACVAFEMGLQLEAAGEKVSLVLLDGSPDYVASHTGSYKQKKEQKGGQQAGDADALTYFIQLFKDVDYQKVSTIFILNLCYCSELCSILRNSNITSQHSY